jgi:hypothetical protein
MAVATLTPAACGCVEDFVREALGCACPPAVFENIRLETDPAGFPGIPGARLLAIGGRLLVLLVDGRAAGMTAPLVSALLLRGRELRDSGGFNRFRLVIVAPQEGAARKPAAIDPDSVDREDERLHLHMIVPSQLPDLLRTPWEVQ